MFKTVAGLFLSYLTNTVGFTRGIHPFKVLPWSLRGCIYKQSFPYIVVSRPTISLLAWWSEWVKLSNLYIPFNNVALAVRRTGHDHSHVLVFDDDLVLMWLSAEPVFEPPVLLLISSRGSPPGEVPGVNENISIRKRTNIQVSDINTMMLEVLAFIIDLFLYLKINI